MKKYLWLLLFVFLGACTYRSTTIKPELWGELDDRSPSGQATPGVAAGDQKIINVLVIYAPDGRLTTSTTQDAEGKVAGAAPGANAAIGDQDQPNASNSVPTEIITTTTELVEKLDPYQPPPAPDEPVAPAEPTKPTKPPTPTEPAEPGETAYATYYDHTQYDGNKYSETGDPGTSVTQCSGDEKWDSCSVGGKDLKYHGLDGVRFLWWDTSITDQHGDITCKRGDETFVFPYSPGLKKGSC